MLLLHHTGSSNTESKRNEMSSRIAEVVVKETVRTTQVTLLSVVEYGFTIHRSGLARQGAPEASNRMIV